MRAARIAGVVGCAAPALQAASQAHAAIRVMTSRATAMAASMSRPNQRHLRSVGKSSSDITADRLFRMGERSTAARLQTLLEKVWRKRSRAT